MLITNKVKLAEISKNARALGYKRTVLSYKFYSNNVPTSLKSVALANKPMSNGL